MSDEMMAYWLTGARVQVLRDEPDTVVLRVDYGDNQSLNLMMTRNDFMGLAKRLATDAVMLCDSAPQAAKN